MVTKGEPNLHARVGRYDRILVDLVTRHKLRASKQDAAWVRRTCHLYSDLCACDVSAHYPHAEAVAAHMRRFVKR